MKNKKIICIPFAYKPNMQSGENVFSLGNKRLLIYMKNASVALVSAKCSQQDGLEKRSVRYKFNDGQVLMLKLHRARHF